MTTTTAQEPLRTGGNDAVAFTSGPQGAPFSAGVVHAWLAADRERPLVATGISMGTIAAAAMRRAYEELEHQDSVPLEEKRWRWYQRYYQAVTENPVGPLWNALPNPVDFFAETPPVRDPSVPDILRKDSEEARRHFYLLIKCGLWLARLPVRVSTLATLAVMYVRRVERYATNSFTGMTFYWTLGIAALGVYWHVLRSPQWIFESRFCTPRNVNAVRPIFGWGLTLLVVGMPPIVAAVVVKCVWLVYRLLAAKGLGPGLRVITLVVGCLVSWLLIRVALRWLTSNRKVKKAGTKKKPGWITALIAGNLDIAKGLLHPYEIERALYDLFVKDAPAHVLTGPATDAVKALFVCAALEETDQVILQDDMPVIRALTAALAIPGLLPPQEVESRFLATHTKTQPERFHVIDGAAVRTNPIPAFFNWCKKLDTGAVAKRLQRDDLSARSLHVVYSVPTGYDGSVQDAPGIDCPDIVRSMQQARQLAKRRDTRQEVRQTNNLSRLELHRRQVSPEPNAGDRGTLAIFADEIAPRQDIDLGNELSPDHDKLRRTVADGCRATLETLYRAKIRVLLGEEPHTVPCATLLRDIAPRRRTAIGVCAGLREVCDRCVGQLEYRPEQNPNDVQQGVLQTYGRTIRPTPAELAAMFPQLAEERQKVVFLGSGGVFRGAFHIGVLAAMNQTRLYPDLVVGASVGTLMGGALCRMTVGNEEDATKTLAELTKLFSHVDTKVSLTYSLKSAAKQLGIRARKIRLSPAELARKVKQGSQADAGYAATGAPPVLTDALSYLFTIPHRNTAEITAEFVAGHFSAAVIRFLQEVRLETLTSFEIRHCIMGISLLEDEARRLMKYSETGEELSKVQPYQNDTPSGRRVAFFGTTSFLNGGSYLLLGRDFLTASASWNATQATLCSSAFPAVFAARMEADLMPGAGRADRFFADGGMFDNLPFFPALEILAEIQSATPFHTPEDLRQKVCKRAARPNLIISAGLNAKPTPDAEIRTDTMFAIKDRAETLSYESKTSTFASSAEKSLNILKEMGSHDLAGLDSGALQTVNGFVAGAVVEITPTDAEHINPTFAFCKALGLEGQRVQRSIGDGCFRTLKQFSEDPHVRLRLRETEHEVELIPRAQRLKKNAETDRCPYFTINGADFRCPFTQTSRHTNVEARSVYEICRRDVAHQCVEA